MDLLAFLQIYTYYVNEAYMYKRPTIIIIFFIKEKQTKNSPARTLLQRAPVKNRIWEGFCQ